MTTHTTPPKKIHQGRNIKRFREMMGIKQEALALDLGEDWSQKKVSRMEEKEIIEDDILAQVAAILRVPEDVIKNFDEDNSIFNIQNNYDGAQMHQSTNFQTNHNCTFNPLDKIMELFEENKKLYERLLQSEQEKVELLKRQ